MLFERYACMRPLNRVSAWMSDQGLPVAAGTMANSVPRFLPMFEPLAEAILEHQSQATVRHGDETTWRVQALRDKGRSSRAWLWTSVSADAVSFHIDRSRSAEAAEKLFAAAVPHTVLVCDRYSAYKRLARELGGAVTLAWCWVHQRRDFINCAAGHTRLTDWCQEWIERIAAIYRLNEARLAHYDHSLEMDRQTAAFEAAQAALREAVDGLFAHAERKLAELPESAHEGKPLRSLVNHRQGLCVFLDRPQVPLDNNQAELRQRGRRAPHGADVRGRRHPQDERHRRPALAGGMAGRVRRERRACAGGPVAVAAMVDERGTQARPVNDTGMTGEVECRYYGRNFTSQEMALLRALIAASPPPNRYALSKEFCRRIGWLKPDGGLKDMMARVTMLAMHRDGLITLPTPKWGRGRAGPITFTQDTEPPLVPVPTTLDDVRPLTLRPVVGKTREGKRWNEFVARHHYLGYKTLVGAQMRYAVHDRDGWPIAPCSASAPQHGSWRPATASSDGRPRCARRTLLS